MVESVNINNLENTPAPEGHDEAMAAKMDQENAVPETTSPVEEKPVKPDNVPEKFWDAETGAVNVEALLKAQADAEAALRKTQSESASPTDGAETPEPTSTDEPETPEVPETPETTEAVAKAEQEYAESGSLTDETYEALAKQGLSKDVVDGYIEGQVAKAEKLTSAAYGELGGADEYQAAVTWARDNLSTGEIQALDVLLTSADPSVVAEGAKMLATKYNTDGEVMPTKQISGDEGTSNGAYFKSSTELVKAMSDSRYRTDNAYRAEVEKKMNNAAKAGVSLF